MKQKITHSAPGRGHQAARPNAGEVADEMSFEPGHVGVITEEMLTQVTDRLLKGKIDEALYATIPAKVCACASLLLRACTS